MTTNNVQLPTESMIVAGFEAVSMFHDTDAYKQMTGCQGAAESARICWAAMVAEMPTGETPRQDVAPSDAAILSARAEATWARYGDEADIKFGRTLLSRFGHAAMPADAPAYRLLGAGEIIQANDEFIANDGVTWSAAGTGIWVGMPYTHVLKTARRRIEGES